MKTKLICLISACIIGVCSSMTGQWTYTNSEVRLSDYSDNVGIGISFPTSKLHVVGQQITGEVVDFTAANPLGQEVDLLNLSMPSSSHFGAQFIECNRGSTQFRVDANGDFFSRGSLNLKKGSSYPGVALSVGDKEALWFNGTYFSWGYGAAHNFFARKVGIGTSNPETDLEVAVTGYGGMLLSGNNANDVFLKIDNGGGKHYIFDDHSDGHSLDIESRNDLNFNTNGPNERMKIHKYGLVEIKKSQEALRLSGGSSKINFTNGTAEQGALWYNAVVNSMGLHNINGKLTLGVTTNWNALVVNGSGNVGIGTDSPSEALHVIGQMALENPNEYRNVIAGVDGSRRLHLGPNSNSSTSRSFISLWGDETHGENLANPKRAGETEVECHNFQVNTNKPAVGFGTLNFEVRANGQTHTYGDLYANGVLISSDRRLKKSIVDFDRGLEEIRKINPKQYYYNGRAGTKSDRLHTGVVAQEFAKVVPEGVKAFKYDDHTKNESEDYLAVDEGMIKFMLINAVKELADENDELQSKNEILEQRLNKIEAMLSKNSTSTTIKKLAQTEVVLNGNQRAAIDQNRPNPFTSETTIDYFIPDAATGAHLNIFNTQGQLIKSIALDQTGNGQINIKALDMATGNYLYELVTDAGVIGSKTMVLVK